MTDTVLTFAEIEPDGGLADTSRRALTFARRLADAEVADLHAATIGAPSPQAVDAIADQGVAVVHAATHPLLSDYAPQAWAEALGQLLASTAPRAVVAAGTNRGGEVMANLAARTYLPLAANVTEVAPDGDGWLLTRLRWGGVLLEDARLEAATALMTAAPHHTVAEPAASPGGAAVTVFAPDLDDTLAATRVRERATRSEGIGLATAKVVVSGGRGVGSAEGFTILEELASLLDGAVGCSRVATNNGWRSHNDQVGQTGTRVAPDLYIACGISGATQHWVGCMSSKRILAINTDAEAPMVTRAHYAVIGDLHDLLPALVAEVRSRKGVA